MSLLEKLQNYIATTQADFPASLEMLSEDVVPEEAPRRGGGVIRGGRCRSVPGPGDGLGDGRGGRPSTST